MHVGLVCPYSLELPGGVQAHVLDLASHLVGAGHAVSVISPGRRPPALVPLAGHTSAGQVAGVRWNGSVAPLALSPAAPRRVRQWCRASGVDLVHVHEPTAPWVSTAALGAPVPVVVTVHSSGTSPWVLRAAGLLLRSRLSRVRGTVAVSSAAQTTARHVLGHPGTIIPNGVDTAAFAPRDGGAHGAGPVTADRPLRLVFVGRAQEPRKGLPVLLQALAQVRRRGVPVHLDLIGPGGAGAVGQPGVPVEARACTTVHGALGESAKRVVLGRGDLFVAPHLGRESFGIVLVEAMAAGLPVVASRLPAFEQVLGGAAALVEPGDPGALAEEICRLAADPARRERMRTLGREQCRLFDWDVVGPALVGLYEHVLREQPPPSVGRGACP